MRALSRRGFLGSVAGVAAAAALPSSRSARAAVTPLVGGTVSPSTYSVSNSVQAAKILDGYVGLPLGLTIQKIYLTPGSFPSQPSTRMTSLAAAGCQFLVSVLPSRTMTPTEQSRLAAFLAMLNNAGISYRVALFSECNNTAFATQQEWQKYWSYYAPTVRNAGVACAYDPGCNSRAMARAVAYFPSNPAPDELWMDYYATSFRGGVRLAGLIGQAQAVGISAGLGEWGWHAGSTQLNIMTMPWWNTYCSYLSYLASQRDLTLGAIYFGSEANGNRANVIGAANDPRIRGIQQVANAVQTA